MIKKALLAAVLVSLMISGSVLAEEQVKAISEVDAEAVTFIDDLDREVTVAHPERVAALLGSFAEIWQLAGGNVCASADDAWDDMGLEMPVDAVNLGNTKEPSVEKLLAAQPDFILASVKTRANLDMLDTLEATGIPTAYFNTNGFEDYLRMLKVCTDITGRDDLYKKNGLEVQAQIREVIKDSEKRLEKEESPKVLVLRASASSVRAKNSEGNVLGEMLLDLGCINIADSEGSLLENLNVEYILKENPDYIFTVQSGDDGEGAAKALDDLFYGNPAWAALTAVQEGKIYHMDKRLYNLKPNARWGEAYEGLERILSDG